MNSKATTSAFELTSRRRCSTKRSEGYPEPPVGSHLRGPRHPGSPCASLRTSLAGGSSTLWARNVAADVTIPSGEKIAGRRTSEWQCACVVRSSSPFGASIMPPASASNSNTYPFSHSANGLRQHPSSLWVQLDHGFTDSCRTADQGRDRRRRPHSGTPRSTKAPSGRRQRRGGVRARAVRQPLPRPQGAPSVPRGSNRRANPGDFAEVRQCALRWSPAFRLLIRPVRGRAADSNAQQDQSGLRTSALSSSRQPPDRMRVPNRSNRRTCERR